MLSCSQYSQLHYITISHAVTRTAASPTLWPALRSSTSIASIPFALAEHEILRSRAHRYRLTASCVHLPGTWHLFPSPGLHSEVNLDYLHALGRRSKDAYTRRRARISSLDAVPMSIAWITTTMLSKGYISYAYMMQIPAGSVCTHQMACP